MNLRIFHSALPLGVIEEGQHIVKRLFKVVQHISEGSPLSIVQKLVARNMDGTRHR